VPLGAVVEPLLLLVVEPRVARVAGHRRHPRAALSFSSLASGFGLPRRARAGKGLASLLLLPVPLRLLRGGGAVVKSGGRSGGGAGKRGRRKVRRGRGGRVCC